MIVYLIFLLLSFIVRPILAAPTAPKAKLQSTIDITQAVKPSMDNTEVEILQTFMDLSYVYTANRRGMSSTVYPFPTLWQLRELKDVDINIPDGQSQSLSQGNFIVFNTQNDLKNLLDFFYNKKIICQPKNPQIGLTTFAEDILFEKDIPLHIKEQFKLSYASHEQFFHSTCQNAEGNNVEVIHKESIETLNWKLEDFEFHTYINVELMYDDTSYKMRIFGRPIQGIARSVRSIEKLQEEGYYYFDAGSFVDGASSLHNQQLSLHRGWQFDLLERLNPIVLGFGATELINGFDSFAKEIEGKRLPYIATNIKVNEKQDVFPQFHIQDIRTKEGRLRVGFVSITDPRIINEVPILTKENFQVLDPIKTTQGVVDELNSSQNPPDLIIALGNISSELLGRVRNEISGVDIIVGDPSLATLRIKDRTVQFVEYDKTRKGAPLTLPTDGLSELTIIVAPESNSLQRLRNIPIHVHTDLEIDEETNRNITNIRKDYYSQLQEHVIIPPREGIHQQFKQEEWEQFICESIRFGTDADGVLLRDFTKSPPLPGPLSKQQLLDSITMMDIIEEYYVQGLHLKTFLSNLKGEIPITCGARPQDPNPRPRGASIDPQKMYRIVTTDQTRLSTSLKWLLPTTQNAKIIDKKIENRKLKFKNQNILARDLVYETIIQKSQEENVESITTYLMETQYKYKPPTWTFKIDSLSLTANDFIGMQTDVFAEVPETMATNPSSQTLGHASQINLIYSSNDLRSTLKYTSSFSELTTKAIEDEPITTEVTDDWITSFDLTAVNKQLPIGPTKWSPYSELTFNSEFTPTEDEEGNVNPKQSDLSLAFGITALSYKTLKSMKISVLANQDISTYLYEESVVDDVKPLEYATRVQFNHQMPLFKHFIWIIDGDLQFYGDTINDDATDLQYRLYGISKLSLPFSRFASITLYGEGLGIQGRIPETKTFGFAWNTGISLDVVGSFDL